MLSPSVYVAVPELRAELSQVVDPLMVLDTQVVVAVSVSLALTVLLCSLLVLGLVMLMVGGVVSMVTESAAVAGEVFSPGSVCVAVTDHTPSARVPRVMSVLVPAAVTDAETSVSPDFVAVTVTDAPLTVPATVTVGVVSEVIVSPVDPEFDDAFRVTPVGAVDVSR